MLEPVFAISNAVKAGSVVQIEPDPSDIAAFGLRVLPQLVYLCTDIIKLLTPYN